MYDEAIKISPNYFQGYFLKGMIFNFFFGSALYELRRFEESILMYNEAIKISPCHIEAHYKKGMNFQLI